MSKRTLASLSGTVMDQLDPTKSMPVESNPEATAEGVDRKMGFSEREGLRHEIEMIERSCNQSLRGEKDDPRVLRDLYKKKMLLAHDDELTFRGDSKDAATKELIELETDIKKEIPSKNEMWPKNDISAKSQAVRHNLHFQRPEMDAKVRRWQELKRRLEPENPFAQNLDTIRPD